MTKIYLQKQCCFIQNPFCWVPQPAAAALVAALVEYACDHHTGIRQFARRLSDETGTRLIDWVDHLVVPENQCPNEQLLGAGFALASDLTADEYGGTPWRHAAGLFPLIVTSDRVPSRLAVGVDSVADFVVLHGADRKVEGSWLASMHRAMVTREGGVEFWVVERHGHRGWMPLEVGPKMAERLDRHRQAIDQRARNVACVDTGFTTALEIVQAAVEDLGVDRACDLFFSCERQYWQRRNHAARVQRTRQDVLGLGWANHDHHTYRSSREHFHRLVAIFETLGCECRERFYAGAEAGWGAQVLEQAECGVVVFADVDLTPEEVDGDFAHEPLPARTTLGTVGLWCRLHGEAFLKAGMHHLECQFDFDAARRQLASVGVKTMAPFTDFDFLKQAFTEAEMWDVDPGRIEALLDDGLITSDQAERFRRDGALGSHLEILERNDGYKGFNQTGVSAIIRKTDPRGS